MTPFSPTDLRRSGRPVPAFAPARGGDDIEAARVFVEDAVMGMRSLHVEDRKAVHDWLDRVERGARALQARAISRAVEAARIDVGTARIGDTIASVGALIGQYEMGLVDVEVQIEAGERILPCEDEFAPRREESQPRTERDALDARFDDARQLLAQLMPKIDTAPHTDALDRLLAFDPQPAVQDTPPARTRVATLDVEAFLPGLVDHAIGSARRHGKKITASYVAKSARIPSDLAGEWIEAAKAAIGGLVATTMDTPERRRARGETSAAHLAIRAEGTGEGAVALRLDCAGTQIPAFEVDRPHTVDTGQRDGNVWIIFTVRPESPACGSAA